MAKKLFGLAEKDVKRLENCLRDFEQRSRQPVPQPRRRKPPSFGGGELFIAKVVSDATGGGYYNCYLQTLDATDWETNTNLLQNPSTLTSIVVANLAEVGSSVHNLDAGNFLICWKATDDESNERYIGVEIFGRHTFGEW